MAWLGLGAVNLYARAHAKLNHFKFVRSDRGAAEYVATPKTSWDQHAVAYTIGNAIFWMNRSAMRRVTTLRHELSHVQDHNRLTGVGYYVAYGVAHLICGYQNNPFEKKARRVERRRKRR